MKNPYSSQVALEDGENKVNWPENTYKFIRDFSIFQLNHSEITITTPYDQEAGVVVLEGSCEIRLDGTAYSLSGRADVFSGLPYAFYIPSATTFYITANKARIAYCAGKCTQKRTPALITPDKVKVMSVGKDNWQREVRLILGPESPAENLIIGETINPPGNWSGTPPHKHEINNLPCESLHEELYYYRFEKSCGYGVQRLYSPERNIEELIPIRDGTVTFMPWGYHQVVSGPGYNLYYLFFLSGVGKKLIGHPDSEHIWINE